MKILVGQAYHLRLDPKNWEGMGPFPPLGALYAAAVLRDAGHIVAFHDSMVAQSPAEWAVSLEQHSPELALLFEDNFNYLTKMCLLDMRDAAREMIAAAKRRGALVVAGGSDCSDVPELYLEMGVDVVIRGEGEGALLPVIEALQAGGGAALADIAGIAYLGSEGQMQDTGKRKVLRDLNALPQAAWDLIDFDAYRELGVALRGAFELNLVTSRGCPFHCNWCAKPIWGRTYNVRSAANVADEIEWLARHAKPERLWVMDDIMGLKPRWMAGLADELEARGVSVPFKCLSRADLLLRDGEVEALARAGCDEVWIGAESGSQKILDAMEKGTDLHEIEDATVQLRAAGIRVFFFIQYGYPGETWADIQQTIGLVRRCRPDGMGVSVSYPLPGTAFHKRVQSELGSKRNWQHSDDLAMLYNGPYSTEFYRLLHRYTHFHLRIAQGLSQPVVRRANGRIDPSKTLRRALGTVMSTAQMLAAWPVLQWRRTTSSGGLSALRPQLTRDQARNPDLELDPDLGPDVGAK